jgi:hypothetical protein
LEALGGGQGEALNLRRLGPQKNHLEEAPGGWTVFRRKSKADSAAFPAWSFPFSAACISREAFKERKAAFLGALEAETGALRAEAGTFPGALPENRSLTPF